MKYLIIILAFFITIDVFAAGRVNPFTGQPLTYSLSEMQAREVMGGGAYDRMRRQTFTYRQSLNSAMGRNQRHYRNYYSAGDFGSDMEYGAVTTGRGVSGSNGGDYHSDHRDVNDNSSTLSPQGWAVKKVFKHAFGY